MNAKREAGYSLAELLVVVAIISMVVLAGGAAWQDFRKKTDVASAARMMQGFIHKARMLSVYRGINHFVVLDPARGTLGIYGDSSLPTGKFDAGDARVAGENLSSSVALALPARPSPLPSPLGGGSLTEAWLLPLPDAAGAWGNSLRGIMTTPAGMIQGAESTPRTIGDGVIVFSDRTGQASSVALRGQVGSVRSFQLLGSTWKEL